MAEVMEFLRSGRLKLRVVMPASVWTRISLMRGLLDYAL
jgi:hypothetical protein